MRSLNYAGDEIRRLLSKRLLRIALVVAAVVPLLYGALYLWAFWDPYARLEDLPVALVNLDRPTHAGDETITAGDDLARELLEKRTLGWDLVDAKQAADGVRSGRYYMSLTIPADFSARIASADDKTPQRATLRVSEHESKNMLASQIGDRVFAEVRAAAAAGASEGYYENVFVGFSDAREGLEKASDGANTLADGLGKASDGADRLSDGAGDARRGGATLATGLGTLKSGAEALASGSEKLSDGSQDLAAGTGRLRGGSRALAGGAGKVAAGAGDLASGMKDLAAGSGRLSDSAAQLAKGAADLDAGVGQAVAGIDSATGGASHVRDGASGVSQLLAAYAAAHPEAASDPTFARAKATADAVADGSKQLAAGLSTADSGVAALKAGSAQLAAGAEQLATGAAKLDAGVSAAGAGASKLAAGAGDVADGAGDLASGARRLDAGARTAAKGAGDVADGSAKLAAGVGVAKSGATKLADGLAKLESGTRDLASGLTDAYDGSTELATGLTAGVDDIPAYTAAQQDAHAQMMSDPVELETVAVGEIENYGTGFTAYFVPLALWVGALIVYLLVKPLSERAASEKAPAPIAALAGLWPGLFLGAVQALLLVTVLRLTLGLQVASVPATYAFVVLVALVFAAIMQCLSVAFGPAGKLLAIVLLMLQLTSAAGTFPIELLPGFFQAIHPWLPFTYVVQGLREAIAGGDWALLATDAWALVAFGAAAYAVTSLTALRARRWDAKRFRPGLEL